MHIALVVLNGVHKGRHIPLATTPFRIGRGKHCQLRPVREDVGREHCAVLVRDECVYLKDYGSTNGTILNGSALVKGELEVADGDVFEVGPLRFRLVVKREPVPAVIPSSDDADNCFSVNEIFTGMPGEHEPKPDSTIQVSDPSLAKKKVRRKAMPDESEKLY